MAGLRIVVGGDDAGFAYKETIIRDLESDPRVSSVIDVGPTCVTDKTAYSQFAIEAAEMISTDRADRGCE